MNKILIVDDQQQNLYLLRALLGGHGYQVREATNGAVALELARADPPEIIISDILMPVMDGFSLCHEWKRDQLLKDIPFVFYTATYTDPKDEALGLSLGATRFIVKPVETQEFISILEQVIAEVESGVLAVPSESLPEGMTYYRMYNEALIRKLESKMLELEKISHALEGRVRERTAELETANKELDAFSFSVSHDLRAPLRAIDGYARILQDDYFAQLPPEALQCLSNILEGSQRMTQLINDLLALSRVTRQVLKHETVDLSRMAQEIATELRKDSPQRSVEFIIANGLTVNGDPGLLQIVMENLLNNAWKYTSRREQARIEFGSIFQSDGSRVFFVRDNGAGFNMAHASQLFGAFQRLHLESDFEGTGIGLATVQRIIERHGGRVWAESEVDKGATFYLTL
jgi:signal transduction histidine kinase